MSGSAAEQLNKLISNLETELGISSKTSTIGDQNKSEATEKKQEKNDKPKKEKQPKPPKQTATTNENQPEITKLDIRVGKIVKVWKHETADK